MIEKTRVRKIEKSVKSSFFGGVNWMSASRHISSAVINNDTKYCNRYFCPLRTKFNGLFPFSPILPPSLLRQSVWFSVLRRVTSRRRPAHARTHARGRAAHVWSPFGSHLLLPRTKRARHGSSKLSATSRETIRPCGHKAPLPHRSPPSPPSQGVITEPSNGRIYNLRPGQF